MEANKGEGSSSPFQGRGITRDVAEAASVTNPMRKNRKRSRSASSSSELSSSSVSTSNDTTTDTSSTSSSTVTSSSSPSSTSTSTSTSTSSSTSTSTSLSRSSSDSVFELIPPSTRGSQLLDTRSPEEQEEVLKGEDLVLDDFLAPSSQRLMPEKEREGEEEGSASPKVGASTVVTRGENPQTPTTVASVMRTGDTRQVVVKKSNGGGSNSNSNTMQGGGGNDGGINADWYTTRLEGLKRSLRELGLDPHQWAHPNSILFAVLMVTVQESSDDAEEELDELGTAAVVQRFRAAKELFEKTLKLDYEGQLKKAAASTAVTGSSGGGAATAGKSGQAQLTHFLWKNNGELAEHFAILCDQAEDLYHALPSTLMQALIDGLKYQEPTNGGLLTSGAAATSKFSATNLSKPTTRGSTAAAGLTQKCPFRQAFMMWVLPTFLQRVCAPHPPPGLLHLSNPPFALGISSSGSSASNTRSKFQTKVEDWFSGGTRYTAAHSGSHNSSGNQGNKPTAAKSSAGAASPVVKRNVEFASREQRLEKLLLFMQQRGSLVDLKSLGGCRSVTVVVEVDPKTGAATQRSVAREAHTSAHAAARSQHHAQGPAPKVPKPQVGVAGKLTQVAAQSSPKTVPPTGFGSPSKATTTTNTSALLNALARFPSPLTSTFSHEEEIDEEEEGNEEGRWLTHSIGCVSEALSATTCGSEPKTWWRELERLLLDGLSPADRIGFDTRGAVGVGGARSSAIVGVGGSLGLAKATKSAHNDSTKCKQGRWIDAAKVANETHHLMQTPDATAQRNPRPQGRPRTVNVSAADVSAKQLNLKSKPANSSSGVGGGVPMEKNSTTYELDLEQFGFSSPSGFPLDACTFTAQVVMAELMASEEEDALPIGVALDPAKVARSLFQHLLSVCRLPFHGKEREEKDRLWQLIKCCHEATYYSDSVFHCFLADCIDELLLSDAALRQIFASFGGFQVLSDWLKLARVRLAGQTIQRIAALLRQHRSLFVEEEDMEIPPSPFSVSFPTQVVIPMSTPSFVEVQYPALN